MDVTFLCALIIAIELVGMLGVVLGFETLDYFERKGYEKINHFYETGKW